ncbi:unnamed protein product [Heligmosomoides polygyrus]|uniref:Uncharacterized protein n=1 Tax=Heligmosomoides polygyrus TaxID=6339 RepID=A0A183GF37_HELPZ|nr:unnamed protein product [Heligmosomoides polygyrus]
MHVSPILSLFQYYANRNLVGEEEVEMRRASVINHMRMLQYRAQGMMDTDGKPKRNIFGRRQQKKSTHQGLILASLGSLGVHAVEAGLGDPVSPTDEGLKMEEGEAEQHALYTIRERAETGS